MAQDVPLQASIPWYDLTTTFAEPDGSTTTVTFEVRWNFRDKSWYFSLTKDDGTILATGIRIVLGVYLGRRNRDQFFKNGVLIAIDTSGQQKEASFDDIGTRVIVRRITAMEVILGRGFTLGTPV